MKQEVLDRFTILKKLGANIRKARLEKNLSQEELALRIDSARNFIGCIERGEKASTVITLCRIAKVLDLDIADLVKNINN